jgi:hypothetical protein
VKKILIHAVARVITTIGTKRLTNCFKLTEVSRAGLKMQVFRVFFYSIKLYQNTGILSSILYFYGMNPIQAKSGEIDPPWKMILLSTET